jgi:light-regulated signal transduction histidine kinase (bacteriophytochrome)
MNMDNLITDLLLLTRVSRNELNYSNIDMETLVRNIFDDVALPEEKKQFKFQVTQLPHVFADQTSIRQVWVNLISNAIKYSKPKKSKEISVDFQLNDDEIVYFVKDSGVGFNPIYKHKLFGIFQRLHKAEDFVGTGVGLAIVERLIHRHKGNVWADGEEGKGATFYFSIPKLNR